MGSRFIGFHGTLDVEIKDVKSYLCINKKKKNI